jgi:hypothetical protein
MNNHLQVDVGFGQKRADCCLLFPDDQPLESHIGLDNSYLATIIHKQQRPVALTIRVML